MKIILILSVLLLSFTSGAARFQTRINSIVRSTQVGEPHLIKLDNGNVVFVRYDDTQTLADFQDDMARMQLLEIDVDERHEFQRARDLYDGPLSNVLDGTRTNVTYDPSVVSTTEAEAAFKRMRRNYQNNSQCYNRAHVWALEEYRRTKLRSTKLFLFFTNRYIRNYRYKWWFHVSPMVSTPAGALVLDRRYTIGPRAVKVWTDNFIHSKRACPVVKKYTDYSRNQQSQDCYLIPVSMYFWQPRDIEKRDQTGEVKTTFITSEVNHAYWEAF